MKCPKCSKEVNFHPTQEEVDSPLIHLDPSGEILHKLILQPPTWDSLAPTAVWEEHSDGSVFKKNCKLTSSGLETIASWKI